jgi:integrase
MWAGRSIHEIIKRDVVEIVTAIEQRGAPVAANKALKATKTFLRWCVGRAVLDQSPAEGVPLPSKEVARDRVLDDNELAHVILAARKIAGPYGGIVELLALTGQRREEVARLQTEELDLAQRVWTLPKSRTKNAKAHVVHLSEQSMAVLGRADQRGSYVFSLLGTKPFQEFSRAKRRLDQLSSDGVAPSRFASDMRIRDGPARDCTSRGGQNPESSGRHDFGCRVRLSAA